MWEGRLSSKEHRAGGALTRNPCPERRWWLGKRKDKNGLVKSFWGPMQTLLGKDGGDLERVGPSKQREKA